jgi:hypothetical protein
LNAPDTALPKHVAEVLGTTEQGLAQLRYRGEGPRFVKVGRRVIYRWQDVHAYLEANLCERTGERRRAIA